MLTRIDSSNGLFATLCEQWKADCERFGERLEDYAAPHLDHARKVCAEIPAHDRYGIFGVINDNNRIDCIVHVNRARLPGTEGETLRLVWVLLAPRFDFEEIEQDDFAMVASEVIFGAMQYARTSGVRNVKLHLGNFGDREFFSGVAVSLGMVPGFQSVAVRANWLHFEVAPESGPK